MNSKSKFNISTPLNLTIFLFSVMTLPIGTASTSQALDLARTRSTSSGFTVNIILSCDSDTQISQGAIFSTFSGTFSRFTLAPKPPSNANSPTTQDSPPPPRSFIPVKSFISFNSKHRCINGSLVMGSPSCTAPMSSTDPASRSRDANVTPWIPSRPVRPPARI